MSELSFCFSKMRNSCGSIIKHTNEGASTHQEEIMAAAGPHQCCNKSWISYPSASRVMKQSNFGEDEEDLIIKLHALLGDRWSLIAGRLPGRTESEVKNYWDSHLKGKLTSVGIDPNNHRVNQMLRPISICSKNQKRAISDVEDTTYKSCFSRKHPSEKSSKSPSADSSTSSSKESVGSCEMNQYSHNGLHF